MTNYITYSCCNSTNIKYVSPNINVSIDWNSMYDILKTGLYLKNPLNTLCENNVIFFHLKLNLDEQLLFEKFYKYFKIFKINCVDFVKR